MNTTEKIADINAMIAYIEAMSMRYGERISLVTMPPQGDKKRYTRLDIGFGSNGLTIGGEGGDLYVAWTAPDGTIQRARLEELQDAAGRSKA